MSGLRSGWAVALLSLCLVVSSGCAGSGGAQHGVTPSDSHVKKPQFLGSTPSCDIDLGCFIIPCESCIAAVPILYDAYYLGSGGGGVTGGGGDVPPKIPPPLIGTPDGCDADESLCYLIPGDDANVLYYSSGENGAYTVDASGCQQSASSFVSTTDGKICSTWQIYFYTGQYVGQTPNPPPPSLPGVVDAISMHISTANSQYPSGLGNQQVGNGGHLYIEFGRIMCPFAQLRCKVAETVPN